MRIYATVKLYEYYPSNISIHKHLSPIYETMDGWKQDITNAKSYEELPLNAQKYIKRLEEIIGVPVSIISVGANGETNHYFKQSCINMPIYT